MTTDQNDTLQNDAVDLTKLNENLTKIEALSQRLVSALSHSRKVDSSLQGPGQDLYMKAAAAYMGDMVNNPSKIIETQVSYWGKALKQYMDAQQMLTSGQFVAPADETPMDRRFSNDLWQSHPYFHYIKQQYMMTVEAVSASVAQIEGLDGKDKKRLEYFSQQILDLMAPTNFLGTNPDALEKAVETEGQSLVNGLENLVRDIESNSGDLVVTLADKDAFTVGQNIGTSEGS
ncbi:MAG: class I poly(R)-hydroxyalkanoic acid synthase, partial [Pseudoruegeria sp.]